MGFAQELKDFSAGFESGMKLDKMWEELRSKRRASDSDISGEDNPFSTGGGALPRTDGGGSGGGDKTGGDAPQVPGVGEIAWTGATPEQKALLNTIAKRESAGDYNVIYGGDTFSDYKDHPRRDVRIKRGPNLGKTSSAAGKYQFISPTWDRIAKQYGLKDFSPENQDKAAWFLANEEYAERTGRNLNDDLKSNDPKILAGIGPALRKQWTSMPGGIEQTQSVNAFLSTYDGFLKQATGAAKGEDGEHKEYMGEGAIPEGKPGTTVPNPAGTGATVPPEGTTDPTGRKILKGEPGSTTVAQAAGFVPEADAKQMDPDIVRVTNRAAADNPGLFGFNPLTKTLRTEQEQRDMVNKGWSKTMKSKHRKGKAVDLVPINPETKLPDPDYQPGYSKIEQAMRKAAKDEGVPDLKWGGEWKGFKDRPHWEVSQLEQQQLLGGGESPPTEQSVQPALFAQEGGAIPEVQFFQNGGGPAPTTDPYSPTRGYTQPLPAAAVPAPGAGFTPRRVGQMVPGRAPAQPFAVNAEGLSSSQQAMRDARARLVAEQAARDKAAADAAAAKAATAAPVTPKRNVRRTYQAAPGGGTLIYENGQLVGKSGINAYPTTGPTGGAGHYAGGGVVSFQPGGMVESAGAIPDPEALPGPQPSPEPSPEPGPQGPRPPYNDVEGYFQKPKSRRGSDKAPPKVAPPESKLGFAAGGAVPEEDDVVEPPVAAAAPTPAPPPEPDTAAQRIASERYAPETRRRRPEAEKYEERSATPKLKSEVSQAVRGGAGFLQRIFGLDSQDQGIATPETQQAKQDGMRRLASGEGAATQQEISDIDDKVDPDRSLSEGDRQMVRLAQTMQWYRNQGREDDAKMAAGSLMQYGAQRFGKLGSLAGAAYQQYEQTGNKEDLNNAVRFLEQAYAMIPDGASMQVELNEKTGKLEGYHTDADGKETKVEISAHELPQYIRQTMDNSLYWNSVLALADPGMARQKQGQQYESGKTRESRGYERGEETRKHERNLEEEIAKEERETAARKKETEDTNLESDRRAKRDQEIRAQEKLQEEAFQRADEKWKRENPTKDKSKIDMSVAGPALSAATAAKRALDAEGKDVSDETRATYDEALSRLMDATGGDASYLNNFGFDMSTFVYKTAKEAVDPKDVPPGVRQDKKGNYWKQGPDGRWNIPVTPETS